MKKSAHTYPLNKLSGFCKEDQSFTVPFLGVSIAKIALVLRITCKLNDFISATTDQLRRFSAMVLRTVDQVQNHLRLDQ